MHSTPARIMFFVSIAIFSLGIIGSIPAQESTEETKPKTLTAIVDPNPAMNNPHKFAWTVFCEINKPAGNGSNDTVWETWATNSDVYSDPDSTPVWPTKKHRTKQFEILNKKLLFLQFLRSKAIRPNFALSEQFLPSMETRMNKDSFDFIVSEELWHIDGQEAAFAKGDKIDFPVAAKEIKAVWKEIHPLSKPRFHWQPYQGKIYGLIGLHITTKDLPGWFWATWEHVDNPNLGKEVPSEDSFGLTSDGKVTHALKDLIRSSGMSDSWHFYRLNGAQVAFTDLIGRPTILANSEIEGGFEAESSCMTCHARSTIGPRISGVPSANRLSVFPAEYGAPEPSWFLNLTSPPTKKYLQLDFVWSLANAQRKSPGP